MKKSITLLLITISTFQAFSQAKLDDFGRVVVNSYLPENMVLPIEAKSLLLNKLNQITSSNGMGGSQVNPRFIITANVNVGTKDVIAGPPQMISQNLDVTFLIGDAINNTLFSNTTLSLKGVGINENKAFIEAFKTINAKNKELSLFLEEAKIKIINYYDSQCDFNIKEALNLSERGKYDEAISKLVVVPDVCGSCFQKSMDTIQYIYQKKVDKECLLIMREAKTTWMADQNANGAMKVAEIINKISPFSTCEPDASNLMKEIETKLAADEKAKWDFKVQKHRDAVKLKEEALRIDEEDRRRKASLQKEQQKQQYALQKSDQEAGGFKGVVNSLVKLKMSFWGDDSQKYLASQQIDYSKAKLK